MKRSGALLVLVLATAFAAEESCVGRCNSFNPRNKCQCDSLCHYYGSCCVDFDTACPKKIARGDTFDAPEDVMKPTPNVVHTDFGITTIPPTMNTTAAPTITPSPTTTHDPTHPPDPEAEPCSGKPFDAFLQLKNGSIYAFRGDYFFEMDEKAVVPGYPKLIQDVWGIRGPIDAAFTRINCEGKTYIFKGSKYWRFEDDVLDDDYPRDISVGFEKIPTDVDAAFAVPAPGHHGKEKVYFFKDNQYYQYEFKHQPSHEECVRMTKSTPSVLFTRYTDLYCGDSWEDIFTMLFQGQHGHKKGPQFINRDWVGIKSPIDAAMVGRIYISSKPTPSPSRPPTPRRQANRRKNKRRGHRGQARQSRSLFEDVFYYDDWMEPFVYDYSDYITPTSQDKMVPVQNVYFFKKDKYYRVDLQTKSVDYAHPPYPRSIAKYWLGCKQQSIQAEKK
ncbi:vitronectin b [Esox lucius]|uniref:SMB domain-containing protein n=1 Tax=Esox lucius TaxID=8010 RepID=A0A3P8ZK38_ESOLU|nr:vitronectin b [Esox lucius]